MKKIEAAVGAAYADIANVDEVLVLVNHYPLRNVGWRHSLQSDKPEIVGALAQWRARRNRRGHIAVARKRGYKRNHPRPMGPGVFCALVLVLSGGDDRGRGRRLPPRRAFPRSPSGGEHHPGHRRGIEHRQRVTCRVDDAVGGQVAVGQRRGVEAVPRGQLAHLVDDDRPVKAGIGRIQYNGEDSACENTSTPRASSPDSDSFSFARADRACTRAAPPPVMMPSLRPSRLRRRPRRLPCAS